MTFDLDIWRVDSAWHCPGQIRRWRSKFTVTWGKPFFFGYARSRLSEKCKWSLKNQLRHNSEKCRR